MRVSARVRWLVALYPSAWRARYGEEFEALLDQEPVTPALVLDVVRGALSARTAPGGPRMRTRTPALVSLLAIILVLPAGVFLTAAAARTLQPVQHQPARTAQAVVEAFSAMPTGSIWLLLALAPLLALALAALAARRRVREDAEARADLTAFADGCRRLVRQPTIILAALAALASTAVLAFAAVHAVAG